jgi:hypothetical protein
MRRAAAIGAGLAAITTAAIGVIALIGVSRIPVAEYILFPGSMAAWLYKGDNYRSNYEFLLHTIAFGMPINVLLGAILGVLLASVRRMSRRIQPGD